VEAGTPVPSENSIRPRFVGEGEVASEPIREVLESDESDVIPCQCIISGDACHPARVRNVKAFAEPEWLLSVAAVGNDPFCAAAQFGTVVGFVAEHAFGRLHTADQPLGDRAVMRFASGQQDGDEAPLSICECVYLRVAPAARAANSLFVLPPLWMARP
jgi:hypothetical protein